MRPLRAERSEIGLDSQLLLRGAQRVYLTHFRLHTYRVLSLYSFSTLARAIAEAKHDSAQWDDSFLVRCLAKPRRGVVQNDFFVERTHLNPLVFVRCILLLTKVPTPQAAQA